MTLNWDFTNYTFSFLVSLISSILGICYPLFLESIRKIDDQYESTVLAAHFQKAHVFNLYRVILLCALIVSFVAPFVMLLSDCYALNIAVETVHCVFVLALVLVMLYMFKTIQTYYNPRDLADLLFVDEDDPVAPDRDPDLLMSALDMMRYTSKRSNPEVYTRCKGYICRVAYSEQMPVVKKTYNFSQDVLNTLSMASNYATDQRIRPLCYDNLLAQVMFNNFAKGYLGEQNYSTIWRSLYYIMETDNTEWFESYWMSAIQYKTFTLDKLCLGCIPDSVEGKVLSRFMEMHHALGAMLVYHKQYDWLHFILTRDQVSPPKFPLVPSSFDEIVDLMESMEKQLQSPWLLTHKYQMKGMFNDINSDARIVEQVYRYCGLLIIRLFCYNDYNIRYKDPMTKPCIDTKNLSTLKELKKMIERANHEISSYWYAGKLIEKINLPELPDQENVLSFTNEFISEVDNKIHNRIANPTFDPEKFEDLKSKLTELDNKSQSITKTLTEKERESWRKYELLIHIEHQLDESICTTDGFKGWSNYPDVFYHMLRMKIEGYLDGCYSLLIPRADILVSERNVFQALAKLQIPNDYVILTMGVYLGGIDVKYNNTMMLNYNAMTGEAYYGNILVIEKNSAMSAIFIIKASELLKLEATIAPDDRCSKRNLEYLKGSENNLYTNIDQIVKDGNVRPIIKIGKNICVYEKPNIHFLRIRVQSACDDTAALINMKKLVEYLG